VQAPLDARPTPIFRRGVAYDRRARGTKMYDAGQVRKEAALRIPLRCRGPPFPRRARIASDARRASISLVAALYTEYRARGFAEVVGQEPVVQTLENAIDAGQIRQAYLFAGPRGTGKTSPARILAKPVNCERGPTRVRARRPRRTTSSTSQPISA
jgi:hypothetical protein